MLTRFLMYSTISVREYFGHDSSIYLECDNTVSSLLGSVNQNRLAVCPDTTHPSLLTRAALKGVRNPSASPSHYFVQKRREKAMKRNGFLNEGQATLLREIETRDAWDVLGLPSTGVLEGFPLKR